MSRLGRTVVNLRARARARALLRAGVGVLDLGPTSRVLELGAGAGAMAGELLDRYHPTQYVGTDVDPIQVESARRSLQRRWGELPSAVQLEVADARSLRFPDGSFDCVVALMMLHHVEEHHGSFVQRPRVLAEIRRVLRPGGLLVYSDFDERARLRETLVELGFEPRMIRPRWRYEMAVFEAPVPISK